MMYASALRLISRVAVQASRRKSFRYFHNFRKCAMLVLHSTGAVTPLDLTTQASALWGCVGMRGVIVSWGVPVYPKRAAMMRSFMSIIRKAPFAHINITCISTCERNKPMPEDVAPVSVARRPDAWRLLDTAGGVALGVLLMLLLAAWPVSHAASAPTSAPPSWYAGPWAGCALTSFTQSPPMQTQGGGAMGVVVSAQWDCQRGRSAPTTATSVAP